MAIKHMISGLSILILFSCSNSVEEHQDNEVETIQTEIDSSNMIHIDTSEVFTDAIIIWLSENYWPFLDFAESNDQVWIAFSGQCMYKYPITKKNGIIEVKYDTSMDCTYEIGFKKDLGIKPPKIGETFIELRQTEDTLFARYLFPDWIEALNAQQDSHPMFVHKFIRTDLKSVP